MKALMNSGSVAPSMASRGTAAAGAAAASRWVPSRRSRLASAAALLTSLAVGLRFVTASTGDTARSARLPPDEAAAMTLSKRWLAASALNSAAAPPPAVFLRSPFRSSFSLWQNLSHAPSMRRAGLLAYSAGVAMSRKASTSPRNVGRNR